MKKKIITPIKNTLIQLKIMAKYAVNCDLRNVDTNFKDDNTNRLI